MIRLLKQIVNWLEARFPEKVEVRIEEYKALLLKVEQLEKTAVHVDAAKVLVNELQKVKDELASLKASFGFSGGIETSPDIQAHLNGIPLESK
jgi:hypothetical protein